jgi:hypothetical protein
MKHDIIDIKLLDNLRVYHSDFSIWNALHSKFVQRTVAQIEDSYDLKPVSHEFRTQCVLN